MFLFLEEPKVRRLNNIWKKNGVANTATKYYTKDTFLNNKYVTISNKNRAYIVRE